MRIYIGNMSYRTKQSDIEELFSPFGKVLEVEMICDRETQDFKGYAFVEMMASDAARAITGLQGRKLDGRTVTVSEAKPKSIARGIGGYGRQR